MAEKEYLIWDSEPNFEDWKDDLQSEYPDATEEELYRIMYETNSEYLNNERANLSGIYLPNGICAVADLGLWNGRHPGFIKYPVNTVKDCLRSHVNGDSHVRFYVDAKGELRTREAHHDGTNWYWFRAYKPGVTDDQKHYLNNMVYAGEDYEPYLRRITFRLGDLIGDVYGWTFPRRPKDSIRKVS